MANDNPSAQVDMIEYLIRKLIEGTGVEFAADAWKHSAPKNYGVVELMGEAGNDYADGRRIAKGYLVAVTIYVASGSHVWIERVENVLDALQLPHTLPQRDYADDIDKVSWRWQTRIRKSILRDAAEVPGASDPENGGSGDVSGGSDPENGGSDPVSGDTGTEPSTGSGSEP